MKCKECEHEMPDKDAIAYLERRIAQLQSELMIERMKYPTIVPIQPEPGYEPWWPRPYRWSLPYETGDPVPPWPVITCGTDSNAITN